MGLTLNFKFLKGGYIITIKVFLSFENLFTKSLFNLSSCVVNSQRLFYINNKRCKMLVLKLSGIQIEEHKILNIIK